MEFQIAASADQLQLELLVPVVLNDQRAVVERGPVVDVAELKTGPVGRRRGSTCDDQCGKCKDRQVHSQDLANDCVPPGSLYVKYGSICQQLERQSLANTFCLPMVRANKSCATVS